jgi:XTP/dITP diphosphohydrolase
MSAPNCDDKLSVRRLFVATGNPGKLRDFAGLAAEIELDLLPGFATLPSIEETGATFEENARLKAVHYSRFTPADTDLLVADDSGLAVDALGGAPGVHSARFAGRHGDDEANNRLLLERLHGLPPERRTARFVCCLALARGGEVLKVFRGEVEGLILKASRGDGGFGYDPLFYFPPLKRAFGELSQEEKGRFSHRGRAARELLAWLQKRNPKQNQ